MQAFDDLLDGADFDNPAVQAALAKWADELKDDLEDKVDNYAAYIQTLLARADARKKEADRLSKRAKVDANSADRLKDHLKQVLEFRKIKTVETLRFKVTVSGAGGKVPVECNVLPKDLPPEFRIEIPVDYKVNSDAIRAHLEAGKSLPGCRLLERGTYLRIS
jgi:hypothetical protein